MMDVGYVDCARSLKLVLPIIIMISLNMSYGL
jgi:hypothetical protein